MVFSENGEDQTYISLIIPVIRMCECGQRVINTSPVCISDCPGFSTGLLFSLSDCCCLFVNSVCLSVCPSVFTGFSINYFSDQIVVQFVDLRCLCPCSPGESRSKDGE